MCISNKSVRNMCLVLAVVLGAIAGGCASNNPGGKSGVEIGMPPTGKARVVFIHAGRRSFPVFSIYDAGRLVGLIAPKSCITFDCDAGPHQFTSSSENVALLDAELLPDRLYYVEVRTQGGWIRPGVGLYALHPSDSRWSKLPKWLEDCGSTAEVRQAEVLVPASESHQQRVQKHRPKYLEDPKRKQILPEYGQTKPIGVP